MSRFQIKAIALCSELLWWGGLAGLVIESCIGRLSVGVLMLSAMVVSLRLFCLLNGMNIKALLRLVQKYRKEAQGGEDA